MLDTFTFTSIHATLIAHDFGIRPYEVNFFICIYACETQCILSAHCSWNICITNENGNIYSDKHNYSIERMMILLYLCIKMENWCCNA